MGVPHPNPLSGSDYSAAELSADNETLWLLDQRELPEREHYRSHRSLEEVASAISEMVVRGAPAIGITAAYGMVIAAGQAEADYEAFMVKAGAMLVAARPTAVNLKWAVDRCLGLARRHAGAAAALRVAEMAALARQIHVADVDANREMGRLGAELIGHGATILTHCNAGALATGGYGTALGVVRAAHAAGKSIRVIADETRPYLQGSRLTAWELARDGIEVTVVADNAAGSLFAGGHVDCVVVGADRIARNGDVANKIGTYSVACLAKVHDRPVYVVAPSTTVDLETRRGSDIPIEQRSGLELSHWHGQRVTPAGVAVRNPSFDVTPADLVTAIVTERGIVKPVTAERLAAVMEAGH